MSDATATVASVKARVADFVRERDWEKFHRPANLAKAIAVEAAELLELFQWRGDSDPVDGPLRERFQEELSDVLIYCLSAANAIGIDVSEAVAAKLAGNARRYPADEWRGRARTSAERD